MAAAASRIAEDNAPRTLSERVTGGQGEGQSSGEPPSGGGGGLGQSNNPSASPSRLRPSVISGGSANKGGRLAAAATGQASAGEKELGEQVVRLKKALEDARRAAGDGGGGGGGGIGALDGAGRGVSAALESQNLDGEGPTL